jgi:hypothetical protein
MDTDMQRTVLAQDEVAFPAVVESRARRDRGKIVTAAEAAIAILDAVLIRRPESAVIDLSAGLA